MVLELLLMTALVNDEFAGGMQSARWRLGVSNSDKDMQNRYILPIRLDQVQMHVCTRTTSGWPLLAPLRRVRFCRAVPFA